MNLPNQNRNYTISAKVSANQKATFHQKAKENNLSDSEWISSTLDIAINAYRDINMPIEKMLILQEDNKTKDIIIKQLTLALENAEFKNLISKAKINKQAKIIIEQQQIPTKLENIIIKNPSEMSNNTIKTPQMSKALYGVGTFAFLFSLIAINSK
jgi:hypothetical protein